MFVTETDVEPRGRLRFQRYYNSDAAVQPVGMGPQWTHSYAQRIRYNPGDGASVLPTAVLVEDDGKELTWNFSAGAWSGESDVSETLTALPDANGQPSGWIVSRVKSRDTEAYAADGALVTITGQDGSTVSLTYEPVPASQGSGQRLLWVTDASGRRLSLAYDATGRLGSVTDPSGTAETFQYDSEGRLSKATFPDGTARSYLYNESGHIAATADHPLLTAVIDESGQRDVTYDYDASGRGISTRRSNDVDRYDLTYKADGSTDISYPLGQVRNQTFTVTNGSTYANTLNGPCSRCGTIASRSYDIFGNLNQTTDFKGNITKFTYDINRLRTSETDAAGTPDQRTLQTDWNEHFAVSATRLYDAGFKLSLRTSSAFDEAGRLIARCEISPDVDFSYACSLSDNPPSGVRRTTSTWCTAVDSTTCPLIGLLLKTDGPRTDVTDTVTNAYYLTTDESGCATAGGACHRLGDLKSTTDGAGLVTTYVSYDKAGRVTRMKDPNGVLTDYAYTARGWLSKKTVRANTSGAASSSDATTTIAYDPTGTVHSVKDADGVTTTYTYDAAHRLTDITDAGNRRYHYTLDAAGNRTKEDVITEAGTVVRTTSRAFNTLGQLTAITDGLNRTVFNAGFADSYDANGNLVHSQDGLSVQQKQVYDGLDRLVSTLRDYQGNNSATANSQSVVDYDAMDRVTGFSDPDDLKTTYDIDALGNITGLHSPDTGTTTRGFDISGNPTNSVDAANAATASTFDALGRRTAATYTDASLNVQYKYDEADSVTGCSGSFSKRHPTRVVEGSGGMVWCFDNRGNVVRKQQTVGTVTRTTTYTWTLANRLKSVTTPNGTLVTYIRNGLGQITSVQATPSGGTATTVASAVVYKSFGPVASYKLGDGQTVTLTYDATGTLTDMASTAFSLHFKRDVMGNITAIGNAAGVASPTETYGYDPLYRLTGVTTGTGTAVEAYTYNKTGDRLSKVAPGMLTGTYTYKSGTHQLTGVGTTTRQVDARGNTTASVLASGTYGFGYNGRNRLTVVQNNGVTVGSYVLNALGQRVQKTVGETTTRFDYDEASRLLGESGGATTRDYLWLDDMPVGVVDRTGTTATVKFIHADALGSPRVVTDAAGAVQWQWAYASNPFGEKPPVSSSGYVLNLRFPGQYFDAESGLAYNVNRDYEAASGRYIQSDPMGLAAGASTYGYVSANPLGYTDVLGLCDEDRCQQLREKITRVRNELAKRYGDLEADIFGLPLTGPMSIGGHQQQFENKQAQLRRLLNEFEALGCKGGIPSDSWDWATKDAPSPSGGRAPSPNPNNAAPMTAAGIVAARIIFVIVNTASELL